MSASIPIHTERLRATPQQRRRLAEIVAFARDHSPYYRELYRELPAAPVEDPTVLPVTTKKKLMARFDDWATDRPALIEPVDADSRPTPPGVESHTVLVTNLANRVQPILRYELGDRILVRPDRCPCGNALRAIKVKGRSGDVLSFTTAGGDKVFLPSLVLSLDHVPGVEQSQIVHTVPSGVRVRLRFAPGADIERTWQLGHAELTSLFAKHRLEHVAAERGAEPPEQSAGGKYSPVIRLATSKPDHGNGEKPS